MARTMHSEKKTERLYIRTTNSMKTNLQFVADKLHGGNMNLLIDVALKDYIDKHKEE